MTSWTAPTNLNLATPAAIQHGLSLLGLDWAVVDHDFKASSPEPLLYAWVDGRNVAPTLSRGIIYAGINDSVAGKNNRLKSERQWADGNYIHGLARATLRVNAVAVSGTVTQDLKAPLSWMEDQFAPNSRLSGAFAWLREDPAALVRKAEHLAIRLALHIGDTGIPVNSQLNGAWEQAHVADLLAYRVAERMVANPGS